MEIGRTNPQAPTSPPGSNSDAMADYFVRGAQDAGNQVEKISLHGKQIAFCRDCFACAPEDEPFGAQTCPSPADLTLG